MRLKTKLFGTLYEFKDLNEVMAKANEEKSGDKLAGLAASTTTEMVAAKEVLSDITLGDLRNNPAIPYEDDEVTRIIQDGINEKIYAEFKNYTVAEFREWLLSYDTDGAAIRRA
ncbi:MAG: ethanolamine ammonia-lyase subunit EutB, partial [Desulfobacterales bacterium]|nr:ethanolamine ammonia-lyase subunit EutB [Desulfobacterales bacterium]